MKSNKEQKEKKCEILEKKEINEYFSFFKIQNKEDGNIYYIKKIKLREESEEELEKISEEFKILTTINSEYIFKYVKSFIKNENFNIVMEYYDELSLRKLINKYKIEKGFIKQKNILNLIKYICLGIKAIHEKRIIHGNLTPENIYITKDKKIKIGNFDIFKQLNNYNDYLLVNNNDFSNYVAPEIIKGENISNKVDIWSLGCILYELCELDYCFKHDNILCLNNKIINEKNPKINLKIYETEIQNLIDSMLKKDPKERPNIDEIYNIVLKYCENKKNKKCEESEIKIVLEITEEDLNNNIYFLDNTDYEDENGSKHYHDSLKELDETKVELFIDKKKYKFQKYFNFHVAKEYEIILKFYNYLNDCNNMFYNCKNIKSLDLTKLNTKNTTNMNNMFYKCEKMSNINISNLNTKNVISMKNMFSKCLNLTQINLNSFDTQNVINMSGMFFGCEKLNSINILNFNTNKVNDMSNLFRNCSQLKNIDLSSINTSKVKNMSGMFSMCENIEKLDLSNFDTNNVENMDEMFSFCENLKCVILNSFSAINLKSMEKMFYNCNSLINLDLSNFKTQNVENMNKIFYGCKRMEILNISDFNLSKEKIFNQMFFNCNNLKTIIIDKNNNMLEKALKEEKINPEIIKI